MRKEILLVVALAAVIVVLTGILILIPSKRNASQNNTDIKISSLNPGDTITSPLTVEGQARGTYFFEGSFPIKILDESGNVLGSSFVRAQGEWTTENFVAFKGDITYSLKTGGKGFLVLAKDNPSGLPQYDKQIKIPVVLSPVGYTKIKVYFNNSKMNPESYCNKVFPAEREILKIEAIGSAALVELLKGPTDEEKKAGFSTGINSFVKLQSLDIDKYGTARVDFDEQLQANVGGSCRVAAIRAEITQTLKQFPTIKNVIISINGKTEGILQP